MVNFNNARKTSVPQQIKKLFEELSGNTRTPLFFKYSENALPRRTIADVLNIQTHKLFFAHSFVEAILLIFNILKIKGFDKFFIFEDDWQDIIFIEKNFTFYKISGEPKNVIAQYPNSVFYINHTDKKTGAVRDIKRLSKLIKKYNSILISDLSFSVGKTELNFEKYGFDVFLLNFFNFYTPVGGCLIADLNNTLRISDFYDLENIDFFTNFLFAEGLKFNFSMNFYKKILYFFINCKSILQQVPYVRVVENQKQNPFILSFEIKGKDALKFAVAMKNYGIDFEFYESIELFSFSFSILNSEKDLVFCKKFFDF